MVSVLKVTLAFATRELISEFVVVCKAFFGNTLSNTRHISSTFRTNRHVVSSSVTKFFKRVLTISIAGSL